MPWGSSTSVAQQAMAVRLVERCTIYGPPSESGTLDTATGEVTIPDPDIRYTGPCLLKPAVSSTEQAAGGGGPVRVTEDALKLPPTAAGMKVGDVVEIDGRAGSWEVVRVPMRSVQYTLTLRLRRRDDSPVVTP